jgi:hypothetical protein
MAVERDDRPSVAEIQATLAQVRGVATIMRGLDVESLERVLREAEYEDSFGPYFDPTGWMRTRSASKALEDVIRALLTCRRTVMRAAATLGED